MKNKTLLLIKPDIVKKKLVGSIISFLEKECIDIINIRMIKFSKSMAEDFYSEHKDKKFYNELVEFIISDYVVVLILKGDDIINKTRSLIGNTNYLNAEANTIRKQFATSLTQNAVHASDKFDSFLREYKILFNNK